MMYIKQVLSEGHENLYAALHITNITRQYAELELAGKPEARELSNDDFGFWYTTADRLSGKLIEGIIFVMNEAGQTIQRYELQPIRTEDGELAAPE